MSFLDKKNQQKLDYAFDYAYKKSLGIGVPSIQLAGVIVSTDPTTIADPIEYEFVVVNDGQVGLQNVIVKDTDSGTEITGAAISALAPGVAVKGHFKATRTLVPEDLLQPYQTAVFTAEGRTNNREIARHTLALVALNMPLPIVHLYTFGDVDQDALTTEINDVVTGSGPLIIKADTVDGVDTLINPFTAAAFDAYVLAEFASLATDVDSSWNVTVRNRTRVINIPVCIDIVNTLTTAAATVAKLINPYVLEEGVTVLEDTDTLTAVGTVFTAVASINPDNYAGNAGEAGIITVTIDGATGLVVTATDNLNAGLDLVISNPTAGALAAELLIALDFSTFVDAIESASLENVAGTPATPGGYSFGYGVAFKGGTTFEILAPTSGYAGPITNTAGVYGNLQNWEFVDGNPVVPTVGLNGGDLYDSAGTLATNIIWSPNFNTDPSLSGVDSANIFVDIAAGDEVTVTIKSSRNRAVLRKTMCGLANFLSAIDENGNTITEAGELA